MLDLTHGIQVLTNNEHVLYTNLDEAEKTLAQLHKEGEPYNINGSGKL
jgi:hypothetical protein